MGRGLVELEVAVERHGQGRAQKQHERRHCSGWWTDASFEPPMQGAEVDRRDRAENARQKDGTDHDYEEGDHAQEDDGRDGHPADLRDGKVDDSGAAGVRRETGRLLAGCRGEGSLRTSARIGVQSREGPRRGFLLTITCGASRVPGSVGCVRGDWVPTSESGRSREEPEVLPARTAAPGVGAPLSDPGRAFAGAAGWGKVGSCRIDGRCENGPTVLKRGICAQERGPRPASLCRGLFYAVPANAVRNLQITPRVVGRSRQNPVAPGA